MQNMTNYALQYEFMFENNLVRPGCILKIRGWYNLVTYECLMHNLTTDKTFLIVHEGKERKMIPLAWLKAVVPSKRSRNNCHKK